MKVCPKCNEEVDDNVSICPNCYTPILSQNNPRPQVRPQTTPYVPYGTQQVKPRRTISLSSNASKLNVFYNVIGIIARIGMWICLITYAILALVCMATIDGYGVIVGILLLGFDVGMFFLLNFLCKIYDWHRDFFAEYITLERKTNKPE